MEQAGARVTRIRTRMFIYILSLSSTIPPSRHAYLACLVPRIQILSHRPAMCFRASRVMRGGSSIQIKEGRLPQRRAMVSGSKKGSWARVTRETRPERHHSLVRPPLLPRVRNLP